MEMDIPVLSKGMVVVTPYLNLTSITADKTYEIEGIYHEYILIKNDLGILHPYKSIMFIEADVYFSMLIFLTLIKLFDIQ